MTLLDKFRALDPITKVGAILLTMMILYVIFLFLLRPIFIHSETQPHSVVMGDHIMTFTSPEERNLNLASIFLAFLGGFGLWLLLRKGISRTETSRELEILKRALSDDEKKVVEEVKKAGEITQDSLRFRLNWSKAKVSAILLQLDRMSIVQRERQGKTYKIFLQK